MMCGERGPWKGNCGRKKAIRDATILDESITQSQKERQPLKTQDH